VSYNINRKGSSLTIKISEEFDIILAKKLQNELEHFKDDNQLKEIIFDLSQTTHIASSGLRIIIFAEERISTGCNVTIKKAQGIVLEVIKMSGIDAFVTLIE
jgi:anti-anti-sigma factor